MFRFLPVPHNCSVSNPVLLLFNRSLSAPACLSSITTLDGSDLEYVDDYKYLGVWLDCELSFQTHIKHLQSKIKSRIGFLFRNKASFTHAGKHAFVKLTILLIFNFDYVIYKIASNTLLSKLDVVYHSAIHFVTNALYSTQHCDLYALFGWPSLHIRRQTQWLQVIYKSLLSKAPPYLSSLVTIADHTGSTRARRYTPVARAPAGISHWSPPKPIPPKAIFPSSSLLPMTVLCTSLCPSLPSLT